ncbi:hypothetical protein NUSPORA_00153 [Nucleospora cyclopteri]
MNDETLHETAVELSKNTKKIVDKLEKQAVILENIQIETEVEINRFNKNSLQFKATLEKLKHDGRNSLILVLIGVVIFLLSLLKM